MNAPAHPLPASQAVQSMKILRATTQEVVVLVAREPGGSWPMVPITSGWPAWPIRSTWRPSRW